MSTQPKRQKKWLNVLRFLAAYLVAAWTFLQFVDWVLNRYEISPHWVDLLLWIFIGIIPSLVIYLYHQKRINQRILKLREKIIFPLNIGLIFLGLYFGFGNSDLGATTKEVEFVNDSGETQRVKITKEEFRTTVPIFGFKQTTPDSTTLWMERGICALLHEDLLQNKNLNPMGFGNADISTIDKITEVSLFSDYYVDGTFEFNDGTYNITTTIRDSKTGEVLNENTISDVDFFNLIDKTSIYIAENTGALKENKTFYVDLPLKEYTSSSLKALEYYVNGNSSKAIDIDSTFALAYLAKTKTLVHYNQGKLEAQDIADKAYKYGNKLPLHRQLEILMQRNLAYEHYEDAEKLVKLQLEVDPTNKSYNRTLYNIYGATKQIDAFFETTKKNFEKEFDIFNATMHSYASEVSGNDDYVLNVQNKMAMQNPAINVYKIAPLLFKGNIDAAAKNIEETKLLYPEITKITRRVYEDAVAYRKTHKITNKDLELFVGIFRDEGNEQVKEYWVENNRVIRYVNNQVMSAMTPGGPNNLVGGMIFQRTWSTEFLTDTSNKVYAIINHQYDRNDSLISKSWKIDKSIVAAETALNEKRYNQADSLYTIAVANNPYHYYLKDALAHVNYINSIDATVLDKQLKDVVGTYGPRTVWIENDKLFYKRGDLPKIELLPISENRYMNMSNLDDNFAFEYKDGKVINCYNYNYNSEDKVWVKNDEEGLSLFLKD